MTGTYLVSYLYEQGGLTTGQNESREEDYLRSRTKSTLQGKQRGAKGRERERERERQSKSFEPQERLMMARRSSEAQKQECVSMSMVVALLWITCRHGTVRHCLLRKVIIEDDLAQGFANVLVSVTLLLMFTTVTTRSSASSQHMLTQNAAASTCSILCFCCRQLLPKEEPCFDVEVFCQLSGPGRMLAVVSEVLGHGTARVGRQELKRRGLGLFDNRGRDLH